MLEFSKIQLSTMHHKKGIRFISNQLHASHMQLNPKLNQNLIIKIKL